MILDPGQDELFLTKALRGERAGFEYLFKTNKNMVFAVALRIVSNKEDAEEVVQDSFMRAFASLSKFNKVSRFSTWLYRITYNTALRKLEQRSSSIISKDTDAEEVRNMPQPEGNTLLQSEERKKFVHLALQQLKTEDYLVISLFYIGEKSVSEICEILNLKRSAVKMRLLRGRKQLETSLKILLDKETAELYET